MAEFKLVMVGGTLKSVARRPGLCCVYVIKMCEAGNYAEPINHHGCGVPRPFGGGGGGGGETGDCIKRPKLAHIYGLVALWHAQKTSLRYLPPDLYMY